MKVVCVIAGNRSDHHSPLDESEIKMTFCFTAVSIMKIGFAMVLCMACALPQITQAAVESPITASGLGLLSSVVQFCGQVDPRDSEKLRTKSKQLLKGLTDKQIDEMRETAEYKRAHSAIDGILHVLSHGDAVLLCTAAAN